jgi:hypothetical protein
MRVKPSFKGMSHKKEKGVAILSRRPEPLRGSRFAYKTTLKPGSRNEMCPAQTRQHPAQPSSLTAPAACSTTYLLLSQRKCAIFPVGTQHGGAMKQQTDVLHGTLVLMVLTTLIRRFFEAKPEHLS